ncbi:MAG: homocysteine S-methyltransferase family protein [Asticcacaulis sp.]|uniref:homocysteine S-methyltransferase family protein n=1 Tax=Asticcacaulis sp. TaxID=1872648 RepID=UPI0039E5AA67
MKTSFPVQRDDIIYLTEGGQETEIMYKFGHELPEFAMYPLLDNPRAMADLKGMYSRVLDAAAKHGFAVMLTGLDYRASPDWGEKLGYSRSGLADALVQSVGFLRDISRPYESQVPEILIGGMAGPRGDAYSLNRTITADEAEDYHSFQIETLKGAGIDFMSAVTFNNVAEAIGVSRASARLEVPLYISFTLDSNHRLKSGPSLKEAIETVDAEAGEDRPDFYGLNCSHPLEFEPSLEAGDWILRLRSLRPNASSKDKMDLCEIGHLEDGDPADLGERMGVLARRYPHIDIWGGCCGTWDSHLNEIARHVRQARWQ